ncbi:DUF1127 domain-containing protein [uncultured Ruegeria sp.]|uniref:DUF1127 domain-containing protein n=1 Tax=uncultured Ruegeria sp. TaxID=259304 RepID=UPI002618BC9C|nr:DUF1127 domain-containing protein [uncultured Ruegeria sp.]
MTYLTISTPRRVKGKAIGTRLLDLLSLGRQRRALARLDDRALEDIGITRSEACAESARPIWDAPDSWCKHLY